MKWYIFCIAFDWRPVWPELLQFAPSCWNVRWLSPWVSSAPFSACSSVFWARYRFPCWVSRPRVYENQRGLANRADGRQDHHWSGLMGLVRKVRCSSGTRRLFLAVVLVVEAGVEPADPGEPQGAHVNPHAPADRPARRSPDWQAVVGNDPLKQLRWRLKMHARDAEWNPGDYAMQLWFSRIQTAPQATSSWRRCGSRFSRWSQSHAGFESVNLLQHPVRAKRTSKMWLMWLRIYPRSNGARVCEKNHLLVCENYGKTPVTVFTKHPVHLAVFRFHGIMAGETGGTGRDLPLRAP